MKLTPSKVAICPTQKQKGTRFICVFIVHRFMLLCFSPNLVIKLTYIISLLFFFRFHYVSQLMYLLFAHDKLSVLPGAAQKVLFRMLEEMANTVYKSNANEHVFR